MRRIVRFWIGPLVRWASHGHHSRLTNVFDGAAYVVWVDAFNVCHEVEFPPALAREFCLDLLGNAFPHLRDLRWRDHPLADLGGRYAEAYADKYGRPSPE